MTVLFDERHLNVNLFWGKPSILKRYTTGIERIEVNLQHLHKIRPMCIEYVQLGSRKFFLKTIR